LLVDAYQFARYNQYIADLAPLQLYSSALAFAPDISTTKTNFKSCMPSWLLHPPKMGGSWRTDVLKLEGHTDVITAITFSPDGKLLGTCSHDGTARVWDTNDATCLLTDPHDRPNYYPIAVAFSSDNSKVTVAHVARIGFQKTIEKPTIEVVVTVYDMQTRSLLRTMQCSGSSSNASRRVAPRLAVAFEGHDDDAIIAVVSHEGQVQAWRSVKDSNILTQEWTCHFSDQDFPSIGVQISQDASLPCCVVLASDGLEGSSLAVLDPKTGAVISRHDRDQAFWNMKFSGRTLVCQMESVSNVELRGSDVENPDESTHLLECDDYWRSFSLANAGDRVAYNSGETHTVHIETIRAGKKVGKRFEFGHWRIVAVAPKGDLVADWHDGCLTVRDTQGLVTRRFPPDVDDENRFEEPEPLTISSDCQYIASGHEEGVTVWHIETGKLSHFKLWHQGDIILPKELAFSQDNRLMASKNFRTLEVWDTRSGQTLLSTDNPNSGRMEFSEDGGDLFFDCSRVHIATATLTTRALKYPSLFGKEIGFNDDSREWVRFDGEDLLWIPDEYRASDRTSDARGCTVALGQADGSVMILTFDLSVL
jgi:WD40 repeat protein